MHFSEKRSYKNSINFFKQRFTWCKSHSPAVNCQPDWWWHIGNARTRATSHVGLFKWTVPSNCLFHKKKSTNPKKARSTNYLPKYDICKRMNLSINALFLFCLLFVLLCCSYITIILLKFTFFFLMVLWLWRKKTTEPQIPLLTATATQRREITKTSSQNWTTSHQE